MSLFDHFKPWKLVGDVELNSEHTGGLLFPHVEWKETHTVVFYEKSSKIRKFKIIGNRSGELKAFVEAFAYKWRDHEGELPKEVKRV